MRKRMVYSFIFLYGVGLLRPIAPYIEFELNKGYIQQYLCINRDKPITVCGGQCWLGRQLKKAAEQQEQAKKAALRINMDNYPIGFVVLTKAELQYKEFSKLGLPPDILYSHLSFFDIFHPPIG